MRLRANIELRRGLRWNADITRTAARAGAAATLAVALGASPAGAADRPSEPLGMQAVSANLRVHYATDASSPARVDDASVQRLLANGEAAYDAITGAWGHQILRDGSVGGDERIDVYIAPLPEGKGGRAQPDQPQPQTSGFITIAPHRVGEPRTIAHELFHLAQYALDRSEPAWLKEGSAEWAEHRITGDYARGLDAYRPELPLTCSTDACGGGYAAWRFFEYLTERHGIAIVKRIFEHARDLGPGDNSLAAIDRALGERGTGLAAAFADFAWTNMTGAYARPEVAAWRAGAQVGFGVPAPGLTASTSVAVERLATRYVEITAAPSAPCRAATFTPAVHAPPGRATRPAFLRGGTGPVIPLASGGMTLGWNTCAGASLLLAVPNTSAAAGVASYQVQASAPKIAPTRPMPTGPARPKLTSRIRLAAGQRMANVMRRGLRLNLTASRSATARVTVTVLADRRVRRWYALKRTATRSARVTDTRAVRIRLRPARTRRRMPRRIRLAVRTRIKGPGGVTRVHRFTVTVTSKAARSTR